MKKSLLILSLFITALAGFSQLKSPAEFLGYKLGSQFSRHHQVVAYFQHVAQNSNRVTLKEYGRTYENRPLILATITSEENHQSIKDIREDNLRRAGLMEGTPTANVSMVWLSYNVHGNEANSTEAAMMTIYELARPGSAKADWLQNTVVIIDPCINPDGRDRYVQFYWQYGNQPYNPDPQSAEHYEPWPGGRVNHYLFDLNRDWAWQTQIETQQRIKEYNKWMPHVHVDFHEQGANSPYYFAPAAKPFHEQITDWQGEFQTMIGKNHAKYFDKKDWFYFTKERFDLLYPSYGDTYPTYNGAIGMTYEQAGHGRAGLGILKHEGDTLTLRDRILHHYTTGLSTIEITSKNNSRVLQEFRQFFKGKATSAYETFVLKTRNKDKKEAIMDWLDANQIQYGAASASRLSGYNYRTKNSENFSISEEDLVISTRQPKGKLAAVLLEPQTKLEDSLTYDITAWALPYVYGVEAYASAQQLEVRPIERKNDFTPNTIPADAYAMLFEWNSFEDARFLATILKEDIKVRFTNKPLTSGGKAFDRGSLIISQRDNPSPDFLSTVTGIANDFERTFTVTNTGFSQSGPDIGSGEISYLEKPRIAMIGGEATSPNEFGANWYYFERQLEYPVTILKSDNFSWYGLSDYDVLVMQEGRYSDFGNSDMEKIMNWVSGGGKLIVIQDALRKLVDSDFVSLKQYNSDEEKLRFERENEERAEDVKLEPFAERERNRARYNIPGAVYRVRLDNTHPLAYGYGDTFYSLKTSSSRYAYLSSQNVGVIASKDDLLSGFVGQYAQEAIPESLVFGVESKGRGSVVYFVDNPLFRAFWYDSRLMFANALFFVGQ